jgi:hypothetical protein
MQGPATAYEKLEDHPFDLFERDVLTVSRLFFMSFHHPQGFSWMTAFKFGDSAFGTSAGPTVTKSILEVVNAMRETRGSGFSYCDPHCKQCRAFMTREERYLIAIVHQLRRGQTAAAQMNAMLLCEGADDTQLIHRMTQLVHLSNLLANKV